MKHLDSFANEATGAPLMPSNYRSSRGATTPAEPFTVRRAHQFAPKMWTFVLMCGAIDTIFTAKFHKWIVRFNFILSGDVDFLILDR